MSIDIGMAESGVLHRDTDPQFSLEDKFSMVKSAGVFDYFDKTPADDRWMQYANLSEKYDLPISAGGWYYTLGRDEQLLEDNIRIGSKLRSKIHNIQIMMDHADGHLISDQEVADTYLRAFDIGAKLGCLPSLEVHINMWSEDFRRVMPVAQIVKQHGIPFRLTLDHSHVIFKMDNPVEQAVFDIAGDVEAGKLVLDPHQKDHICGQWLEAGIVGHMHLRSAAPNNPKNIWMHHPDAQKLASSKHPASTIGRGVQYPFIQPDNGEWHSHWDATYLEPWKEVVRQAIAYNRSKLDHASFAMMTTEFIPYPDYGGGAKYSIFENACACAVWVKDQISQTS